MDDDGSVQRLEAVAAAGVWMNGGCFVLGREIFDQLRGGEELVVEPFQRLIAQRRLCSLKYEGFWSCMDTYKEKQHLDDMYARGEAPWEVWKHAPEPSHPRATIAAGRRGLRVRFAH
ncbi:MAG TPA: hypothetical protein VFW87_02710, partial [Pirellulales bacterium]|nr:hypothetical protein [Pirellulales bacterium]